MCLEDLGRFFFHPSLAVTDLGKRVGFNVALL